MGNIQQYGVGMYRQTIDLKNKPPPPMPDGLPPVLKINKKTAIAPVNKGFIKKGKTPPPESKFRRVAKFLILIGSEQAAEILAELDPDQVDEITKEIALTPVIKPEERDEIFAEFNELFSRQCRFSGSSRGGVEAARRILYAAVGAEKGEEIINRAVPESKENLFSFLEDFSAEQLILLLKNESAQTTAIILSRLQPKVSAETISKLPAEKKPEVLKCMAYQKEISPEVLEQVSQALREKARHIGSVSKDIPIDGMQTLAAILKHGDYAFGDRLIAELEQEDPSVGKNLKDKLYTLDDVINAVDRPIQEKLKTMTDTEIAILLKGRDKDFQDKLLFCVSAGRRKLIREEYEVLGAVPKRDCDTAASEFLSWFRAARESGEIILTTDDGVIL